jgi:hypothetical protein
MVSYFSMSYGFYYEEEVLVEDQMEFEEARLVHEKELNL